MAQTSQNVTQISDADEFQLRKTVAKLNMADWTPNLDIMLQQCVVASYFNFDLVCHSVNQKAREDSVATDDVIGARDRFTTEHCRLRWSYLHLVRKVGQQPSYSPSDWKKSRSNADIDKENRDSNNQSTTMIDTTSGKTAKTQEIRYADDINPPTPKQTKKVSKSSRVQNSPRVIKPIKEVVDEASLTFLKKKPYRNYSEIEGQLWKNNITFTPRKKVDVLDVSQDDFSQYETVDIMGNRATPSNFNIFRDSLRENKAQIHQIMLKNLPDMNLDDIDSNASGSDSEIVPLDFRTAMINNGTKLVIQAKPKEYITIEQEMQAVEDGRASDVQGPALDPDRAIGDLDTYLQSVRKEAFDVDDEDVVLIDPGMAATIRYDDIKLPCDQDLRINNSVSAPMKDSPAKAQKRAQKAPVTKNGRVVNQTLRQAEKQSAEQQPDYYEKQIAAEKAARIRAKQPTGPVFYQEPQESSSDEEERIAANPNLDFNSILGGMGGQNFVSSDEETKDGPRGQAGVRVFRPNLSASQHFREDSRSYDASTEEASELTREFHSHISNPANPDQRLPQTESDSDTAPVPAVVDEKEETDDEKKAKRNAEVEESAKLASSEDEANPRRVQSAKPKATNNQNLDKISERKEAEGSSGEQSSDDDWFANQRKSARASVSSATSRKSNTEIMNAAQAQRKQQERDALMRKLKRQAEEAKVRKFMAKKEKSWVGGSTVPRPTTAPVTRQINTGAEKFDFEALD